MAFYGMHQIHFLEKDRLQKKSVTCWLHLKNSLLKWWAESIPDVLGEMMEIYICNAKCQEI